MNTEVKKTIFVVDDLDTNLTLANEVLRAYYKVITVSTAAKMFSLLQRLVPDLILLDIVMPEMDGFEALHILKKNKKYADIPVIFLTVETNTSVEAEGFRLGVVDFIIKPFSDPVLLNRIKTHLDIDALIRNRTSQLQEKTEQLEQEKANIQSLQSAIIYGFADLLERRDDDTGGHVDRTAAYIKVLIAAMKQKNIYHNETEVLNIEQFVSSARLHDVGKIAISDLILNKPGKLTKEEYEIMKTHTVEGERILDKIASRTVDVDFLHNAKLFAGSHHERWDGKGYPRGLAGTGVPIQGRVMAIADVYDALVSERPYKKAFPTESAVQIIMDNAGTQFDPLIAGVFYEVEQKFEAILNTY